MDRRIRKTKEAIRGAFSKLIKEKKISDITVSELAEKADIDRRTFYLHYSSVSDITREIEEEAADELNRELSPKTEFSISGFFETLSRILLSNFDYYQCITSDEFYYSFEKTASKS